MYWRKCISDIHSGLSEVRSGHKPCFPSLQQGLKELGSTSESCLGSQWFLSNHCKIFEIKFSNFTNTKWTETSHSAAWPFLFPRSAVSFAVNPVNRPHLPSPGFYLSVLTGLIEQIKTWVKKKINSHSVASKSKCRITTLTWMNINRKVTRLFSNLLVWGFKVLYHHQCYHWHIPSNQL